MYDNLTFGEELCVVPEDILNFLNDKLVSCKEHRIPNLQSNIYRQWNLHKETLNAKYQDHELSFDWITDDCVILDNFFKKYVRKIFRFRLSELDPNEKINYHTRHKYPRIHIPLNGSCSEFVIKDHFGTTETVIPMFYGKAYIINVTLLHATRVSPSIRHNAFFSFDRFNDPEVNKNFKIDEYFTDK